jgi:hypothetical protein
MLVDCVGVGVVWGYWHRCSLGDKLAGQWQGLGSWTSPRAGFLEDVLVESVEGVAELCPNFANGHGIEFLKNRCLELKCAGIRIVLMENGKFLYTYFLKAWLKDQQLLLLIEYMDFPRNNISLCSADLFTQFNCLQPTKISPEDPFKIKWEEWVYHATIDL